MKKVALLAAGALATGLSFSSPSQAQQIRYIQPVSAVPVVHFKSGGIKLFKKAGIKRRHGTHSRSAKRKGINRGVNGRIRANRTYRFDSHGFTNPNIGR